MSTQYTRFIGLILIIFLLVGCQYTGASDPVDTSKEAPMDVRNTDASTSTTSSTTALNQSGGLEEEERKINLIGTEIIMRGDDSTFPVGCRMTDVTQTLLHFFSAFNTGDQLALDKFFGPDLEWYSVTEGTYPQISRHFDGRTKEAILSYLLERHQFNEQLRAVEISMTHEAERNLVHLNYILEHTGTVESDDVLTVTLVRGKGAISCDNNTIVAWSMVLDEAHMSDKADSPWPCSKTNENRLLDRLLVCRSAL